MLGRFSERGVESLRATVKAHQMAPRRQSPAATPNYQPVMSLGSLVRFAKAKQDWTANGTFKAFKLEWNGSAFTQLTEEIDIRDVFGFAGKSGQTLAYVEMNGTFFHLQSGCPPT